MIIEIFLGTFSTIYFIGIIFMLGFMIKEWTTEIEGFFDNFLMFAGLIAWPLILGMSAYEAIKVIEKGDKSKNKAENFNKL
jgi:hypothetical protein